MALGKAYFIGEERFTPSQFRRLSRARKVEAMVQWFKSNFQDPVHETSYNGREGGFLWNHGGPYDADEELQGEFSDLAEFEVVQDAVSEVTSDGIYEWAPVRSDDDYDDYDSGEDQFSALPPGQSYLTTEDGSILTDENNRGLIVDVPDTSGTIGGSSVGEFVIGGPTFAGTSFVDASFVTGDTPPNDTESVQASIEALRLEMLARFDGLEGVIRSSIFPVSNRGHNHPPELLEVEAPVVHAQLQEIIEAVAEIREEANARVPNPNLVVEKASILQRFGAWLADASGNGVVGMLTGAAMVSIWENRNALINAAMSAADAALAWANQLPLQF